MSATVIGAALGLDEVQVWKDVDGEPPCLIPHKLARPTYVFDIRSLLEPAVLLKTTAVLMKPVHVPV